MLRSLPELLEKIDQAEGAALYQSLGLTVGYRRVDGSEEVWSWRVSDGQVG